jgi:hypothetical protein
MKYLRYFLKILNPFIAAWNFFQYAARLETYRESNVQPEPYDFSRDVRYF